MPTAIAGKSDLAAALLNTVSIQNRGEGFGAMLAGILPGGEGAGPAGGATGATTGGTPSPGGGNPEKPVLPTSSVPLFNGGYVTQALHAGHASATAPAADEEKPQAAPHEFPSISLLYPVAVPAPLAPPVTAPSIQTPTLAFHREKPTGEAPQGDPEPDNSEAAGAAPNVSAIPGAALSIAPLPDVPANFTLPNPVAIQARPMDDGAASVPAVPAAIATPAASAPLNTFTASHFAASQTTPGHVPSGRVAAHAAAVHRPASGFARPAAATGQKQAFRSALPQGYELPSAPADFGDAGPNTSPGQNASPEKDGAAKNEPQSNSPAPLTTGPVTAALAMPEPAAAPDAIPAQTSVPLPNVSATPVAAAPAPAESASALPVSGLPVTATPVEPETAEAASMTSAAESPDTPPDSQPLVLAMRVRPAETPHVGATGAAPAQAEAAWPAPGAAQAQDTRPNSVPLANVAATPVPATPAPAESASALPVSALPVSGLPVTAIPATPTPVEPETAEAASMTSAVESPDAPPDSQPLVFAMRVRPAETPHVSATGAAPAQANRALPEMRAEGPQAEAARPAPDTAQAPDTRSKVTTSATPELFREGPPQAPRGMSADTSSTGGGLFARPNEPAHTQVSSSDSEISAGHHPELPTQNESEGVARQAQFVSVRLGGKEAAPVDVRFAQRGNDVHFTVRSGDQTLAREMHSELHALVSRLDEGGYRTESWLPTVAAQTAGHGGDDAAREQHAGRDSAPRENPGGQRHSGQEKRDRQPEPEWMEEFQSSLAQSPRSRRTQ